jgi:hypothetical protein
MMRWSDAAIAEIEAVAGPKRGAFAEFVREATLEAAKRALRAKARTV